ncbi:MAG: asparagine synthase-related protein, partial [Steroidobacteraceae bacterium]
QLPRTGDLREYPLGQGRSGMILGRLFPADLTELSPGWKPNISEGDAARYLAGAGKPLTEEYWGAYIAFLASATQPRCLVLRDPSGKLPCYHLRDGGVEVVFSDAGDLSALPLPRPTLNLRYLAAFLRRDDLQIRESGLAEIAELLAGECLELHESSAHQHAAWDPTAVMERGYERSYERAASRLRWVTEACIDAWASVQHRILHCLSGGLDSSIVLGCLARSPSAPGVMCINRFAETAESDERRYARMAAACAKVPLVEACWNEDTVVFDERLLALPKGAKPSFSQCGRLAQLDVMNFYAESHAADAVWKGQGGDHLFLKASNTHSAADYLADRGVGWGFAQAVRDEARLSSRPYAAIVRSAWSFKRTGRSPDGFDVERTPHFLCRDAIPAGVERYAAHPWALAAADLPPGRQRQVLMLADVVNRHRPLPGREFAYEHHPLLSQPIVEQCLRTPTYLHLRGGRHRALARDAFADCVPAPILEREDKGGTTVLLTRNIRRAESFLRDLLLDGILVRERIADRKQLEACLRGGRALMPVQLAPLVACIAAEVWARAWSDTHPTRSADRGG